jgi:Rrf2 family protein
MLSQTAEYALRAVLYLAERPEGHPTPVDAIADDLGIPRNYLSKILHSLAKRDLLTSSRGRGGGFELTLRASEVSLLEVVEPFDQLEGRKKCLLGRPRCSESNPCAAHHQWKEMLDRVTGFFRNTTVQDLIGETPIAVTDVPGSPGAGARKRAS